MQEDPLTGSQSAMMAGGKIGQFYGTYCTCKYTLIPQSHCYFAIILFLLECPNGHKTFIGNVSLLT